MSEVLVVANDDDRDSGYVGDRLVRHGFRLRTVSREAGEVPSAVVGAGGAAGKECAPDLVLLLGSEWSVHAPVDATCLADESALVRDAAAVGVPVLGLCYGAQVLAHATGGRVWRAAVPEIGPVFVETVDPALVPTGPWVAFHEDVFEPPAEATVVARNGCGVQAFTLPGVLAVQFHPEVRPEVFDRWAAESSGQLAAAGIDRATVVAAVRGRADEARQAAYALVDEFLTRHGMLPARLTDGSEG